MSGLSRKIKRQKESDEIENIRKVYKKKPKIKCPICGKRSLFMTNDKKEVYCIRCDNKIK